MFGRNKPCPCRSGRVAKRCCMNTAGFLHKPRSVLPVGDPSKKHDRCYLNFLGGCSSKISREHLFTDAINKRMQSDSAKRSANLIRADGVPLNDPFPLAEVAKVLCTKHNSMMGFYFDPIGLFVYDFIQNIDEDKYQEDLLISGHDLEGFVTQRLCAHHFGGLLTRNAEPLRQHKVDARLLEAAFGASKFPGGGGLLVSTSPDHVDIRGYEITSFIDEINNQIIGARVSLGPVAFLISYVHVNQQIGGYNRPKYMEFIYRLGLISRIILSWDQDVNPSAGIRWDIRSNNGTN